MRSAIAALLLATSSCTGKLAGTVVDADTGRPVANAIVDIFTTGWGMRDGRLVWDKTTRHRTHSDANGKFVLDVDGGINLTVAADGYPLTVTSACPPPNLVRIGGPYSDPMKTRQIAAGVGPAGTRVGWSFDGGGSRVSQKEAELSVLGDPPRLSDRSVVLEAPLGMRFVPGGGNPPPAPGDGYVTEQKFDLGAGCGWLFVRTRGGPIVAVDPHGATEEDPDGGRYVLLTYRLPSG